MLVTRISMFDGKVQQVEIPGLTPEQLEAYESLPRQQRPLIQDAFPDLSPAAREYLKTGTTAAEWCDMFGGALCADCNGFGHVIVPGRSEHLPAGICPECNGAGYHRPAEDQQGFEEEA